MTDRLDPPEASGDWPDAFERRPVVSLTMTGWSEIGTVDAYPICDPDLGLCLHQWPANWRPAEWSPWVVSDIRTGRPVELHIDPGRAIELAISRLDLRGEGDAAHVDA